MRSRSQTTPVVTKFNAPGAKENGPALCRPRLSCWLAGDSHQSTGVYGGYAPVVSYDIPGYAKRVGVPVPDATKPSPLP